MQSIDHLNGRNGDSPVLDVVGVGFGPSNLALAIAIREYNETHAEAITPSSSRSNPNSVGTPGC